MKGQLPEAEQVYKASIEKCKEWQNYDLTALDNLFALYLDEDRYTDAEMVALDTIDLMQNKPEESFSRLARAYEHIARIYRMQARYKEAQNVPNSADNAA